MKIKELRNILKENEDDKLRIYLDLILSKCKDMARESNLIALLMLLLILLFYLTEFSKVESISVGPISIKDLNSVKVFIPLVFAFLILRYILISAHKAELNKIIIEYTKNYFNYKDPLPEDVLHLDDFTRSILPFSIYSEINKLNNRGSSKIGCLGAVLVFPIIGLTFVPFILEYVWIKQYILVFDELNFIQKSSIILSVWIIAISIYYIIHHFKNTLDERD